MNVVILNQDEFNRLTEKVDAILGIVGDTEPSILNGLIDNDQFIKLMGISKGCAQQWRDDGAITFRQYKKRIYYTQSDIEEFLERTKKHSFKKKF